ncbi:MAG: ABC transporter ATP-binding protein [Deltaproteobacteria bacterium]|nr:ABC transporter ATP-binding protein [Deltaproteobacteria bacterium]
MGQAAIRLENVSRVYPGGIRALDGVSLHIEQGEWVAVMGPSGSGKTTLLNLLDGLDKPTAGRVLVLGTDLGRLDPDEAATFRREKIGLIFQGFHFVPYLTALENVMLAQYYHSIVDKKQACAILERLGMADRTHHLPSQLSGGEQQRVCIARALVNEPQVVLADEPTGNLDERNEAEVMNIFRDLHLEGKTILMVTHNHDIGRRSGSQVLLNHGRIVRQRFTA